MTAPYPAAPPTNFAPLHVPPATFAPDSVVSKTVNHLATTGAPIQLLFFLAFVLVLFGLAAMLSGRGPR